MPAWGHLKSVLVNGCFGEIRLAARHQLLQMRDNAALAMAATAQVSFVRKAELTS